MVNLLIIKVKMVNNPQMYGIYLMHKELHLKDKNVKEMMLYHATSSANVISISKNNIDWHKT